MKVKLQFDKRSIQEFLILNAEKILAGVVVLGTLMILYFSIRWYGNERFSFDRTPERLQNMAENAKVTIERTPPKTLDVTDYVGLAEHSRIPVVEPPYDYPNPWDRPLFELPALRGEPPLLAPRQLRGTAEFGAFRVTTVRAPDGKTGPGGRSPRGTPTPPVAVGLTEEKHGKQWVVLTALVPFAEQETAYIDAFSQLPAVFRDVNADKPVYLGYWVERVDVTSPADVASPPWDKAVKFNSHEARTKAFTEWMGPQAGAGAATAEIVAPEYIDPALVFPLGPLVSRRWTASVAHEPEILVQRGMIESGDREVPMEPSPGDRMSPVRPGPGGTIPDESPFGVDIKSLDSDRPISPSVDLSRTNLDKRPFKLLRFFDFNVEPGKQYVYRVRLALRNPNQGLRPTLLADPRLADKTWIETKWSDPSPVIAVPLDWHIFLLAVTPPARAGTEPYGQIMVTKWKPDKGMEYYKDFQVFRGQLVAFSATAKPLPNSLALPIGPDEFQPSMDGDAPVGIVRKPSSSSVDFVTDMTALDFRGGERFRKKNGSNLTSPGEILLMNADGTLTVHNELDDNTAWDRCLNPGTEAKPKTDPAAGPPARTALDAPRR